MSKRFDPESFLEIAKELREIKNLDYNGKLRTAISRAYYAAFLKAQIKLQSLGHKFQDVHRIHADVRENLQMRKKSNIASKLNSLFEIRVRADYKINARIDNSLYNQSITLSENIINLIDDM